MRIYRFVQPLSCSGLDMPDYSPLSLSPSSPKAFLRKGGYSMTGDSNQFTETVDGGITTLGIHPHRRSSSKSTSDDHLSRLPSVSDIEISLDFHLEEADTEVPPSPGPDPHRVDLPAFEPKPDPLGVTLIGDLTAGDMGKIRALAHIELTALFDAYNVVYSRPKRRKKVKENGIFGVPLETLVEQDQKRSPSNSKVPIVFQAMITFLEKEGLSTEGILRVSGADSRAKQLRHDLEEKFYQGLFSWGDCGPHDVAMVMKQFLRELPIPLLLYEYLDAFPQISCIPKTLEQLKALNLLILLLPEENRETLKVLLRFLRAIISHSNQNKMGLNNVAMIMAPNLFLGPAPSPALNLEAELKKAAGTSAIVKMLVHYQDVLWTIPSAFVAQVRHQYTTEAQRRSKEKLLSRLPWKKDKDRSEIYKKPLPSPDQPEPQDGVIRVQAPHLTKSSALIQLDQFTTAADVVAKFRYEEEETTESQGHEKENRPGDGLSNDSNTQKEESNGHMFRNPKKAHYASDADHLFEVGGNIAERCLDPRTKMLDLYHVNPLAEWIIRTRPGR
ncbi:rho GTPase-activating protein 18 [Elysia marginata]|uniref:Rho GTPase-activating protein 18 n=1 Tax=Elysia marginata TaxID=1093978 RepID=A0AAV4JA04_9GAST|nr:rho GTPase-activating protein 18 [Elysia marginata]